MFNYLLKNLPTQFIAGAYVLRKGVSSSTIEIDGKSYYDVIVYTYLDNYLTPFLIMEDGSYKSMSDNIKLNPIDSDALISKHVERAEVVDIDDYGEYNKNVPIAIFSPHSLDELVRLDQAAASEENKKDAVQLAQIGVKKVHTGLEIMGIINRFNSRNKLEKKTFCIPAIKKDANDTFESLIGDMDAYHELIKDKTGDEIVRILREYSEELDNIGNKKYETLGL